ncbi:hypothetical protein PC110_g743 [Phytophthora cactorum]|uniref:PiggyBac transposable element-derived protein domain-containing protein n=1 Tax=Phytophthora cactorum TaxID=29920 RepID=A0A329T3B6_9STRA|nr:hypothetical protein PC110_g743 [Phytophthora cactorum]
MESAFLLLLRHSVSTSVWQTRMQPEKEEEIKRSVAEHLGKLKRAFESGKLEENTVFNMDEAHFDINMDNHMTLGFRGDKVVRYHDVVSGGEGMTLVLKIRGGPSARIDPAMMIFQNQNRSYPIQNVPDDVPSVTYRSGPKNVGWTSGYSEHG